MQIYGGTVHETPGAVHFVARIPIGGDDPSALGSGVDGMLVVRQLAGIIGWEIAGFVEGRRMWRSPSTGAPTGIEWRVLPIGTG